MTEFQVHTYYIYIKLRSEIPFEYLHVSFYYYATFGKQ